ncbi:5-carboxymethyl-2-hydroxymuconate isomerase [Ornithinibacillus sp. L9]|uniref:5-carboxymethyl-2-hydroxymuconate isomerase n=1 Tax=Ornithinibacillus caprae TaxID=2678566 RepID=A0A6N8FHR9_9BACI|nr:5-carboxymethyl-2-hydroxymuconate Delta-isomerase [Ornithinibacillus caprae]MUK88983.1 5-carboxymethyl-2-hydroxymuconate isomerase [Ornithinibacillus caprae]
MPHIIIEYTANLRDDGDIPNLLKTINRTLIEQGDVFPIGGIRSRAIEVHDYVIADGTGEDDAFVHVSLKIGAGRSEEVLKRSCDTLFQAIENHFSDLFNSRYLALSMEVIEFQKKTYKKNNIHVRYK